MSALVAVNSMLPLLPGLGGAPARESPVGPIACTGNAMGIAMKDLLIIRHAKSSWAEHGLADHERPLNDRGREAAPAMGRRLAARRLVPERMFISEALRARETAALMAEAMGLGDDAIVSDPRLYHAEPSDWLGVIQEFPDELQRIAVIGHNPALHELSEYLVDLGAAKFPTAAVAHIRFDTDHWVDAAPGNAILEGFDYPKSGGRDV